MRVVEARTPQPAHPSRSCCDIAMQKSVLLCFRGRCVQQGRPRNFVEAGPAEDQGFLLVFNARSK